MKAKVSESTCNEMTYNKKWKLALSECFRASYQKFIILQDGYWKGYSAIQKLSSEANVSMDESKKWLEKQALWQIYLPKPKHISRPHWTESEPNKIHQADLLFLPHDKVGRKTFKYALVVIDIASRYKDAEPLTSKKSDEVSQAFKKIYSRKLKFPQELIVDPGTEFKGSVTKLFEKNGTLVKKI